jgi:hypothetical protein
LTYDYFLAVHFYFDYNRSEYFIALKLPVRVKWEDLILGTGLINKSVRMDIESIDIETSVLKCSSKELPFFHSTKPMFKYYQIVFVGKYS